MGEGISLWDEITEEEIAALPPEDQAVLGSVKELRRLGSKPGVLEAVLAQVDDEETLADPALRQSLREAEAGELIDITPED